MASRDTGGGQDTQAGRHQCEKGSRKRALSLEENSEGERVKQQDCTGVQRWNKAVKRIWSHFRIKEQLSPPKAKDDKKV